AGAAPAMVLSYGAWQREFGGDTGIVGRDLTDPYTQFQYRVVGVAPPGLDYPTGAEFWIALRPLGRALMDVVARLAPGIPAVAARSDFLALARRLDAQRPVPAHIAAAQLRPFGQTVLGDVRPLLVGLAAAVALLLVGVPSALAAARVDSATPLRLDSRAGSGGKTHNRVRQWLVASQLALAVITLAGAGLLVRSLGRLESLRLGYDPHDLAIL